IPSRSRLYSLEPIGIGTPSIESLSSYLTRLAQEHCVTPKTLIMGEIAPVIMGEKYLPETLTKNVSFLFGNSDAKPAINGMREMTRSLVDALEQLTLRQDLRYLSCLTWKGVIKERGLFRQNKAWCPQCFEQWRQESQTIYEPLLWSFKDVNYCLQHNCQLCDRCPNCDSSLKAIANNSRLGYCDRCKQWLGCDNNNAETKINEPESQTLIGIGELIATAPLLYFPPTLPNLIQKLQLIQFFFERSLRQDLTQFIALGKVLEQLKITIIQHKDKSLNLVGLLIPVCSLAKISVGQLMEEDVSSLSKILDINCKSQIQKTNKRSSLASMFNLRT
ncbi:MAG: TniQ family protein, partial [Waterburya sp.]